MSTEVFDATSGRSPAKGAGRNSCLIAFLIIVAVALALGGVLIGGVYLLGGDDLIERGESVGVVEIQGVITDPEPAVSTLVRFRESDKIKAIILHIDSPGGGVAATQEIYQEVLRTKKVKPVIASVGGVAASGGLYVASAADKITANSGSVTGSIGVIMQMMNVEDLLDKVGVRSVVIKSGKFKDIGSPTRPMTEEERAVLQEVVSKLHRQFVRDVAAARGLDQETVAELADGRIFTGEEAVGLKLIDRIGGFRDAVDLVKEMAGIEGKVRLVYPAADKSWLKEFLENKSPMNVLPGWTGRPVSFQYLYLPGV